MREPFPLQWPDGEPRTPLDKQRPSRFGVRGQVLFSSALSDLRAELGRLGAANAVITSDLPVRRDGTPYAPGAGRIDAGIAVWFLLYEGGRHVERVIACDRWRTHAENMIAIAKTIEALRGLERWGAAGAVTRAFAGFAALPAGDQAAPEAPASPPRRTWREILGGAWPDELGAVELLAIAKARHRAAIAKVHPDVGGAHEAALELNLALEDAERELAHG